MGDTVAPVRLQGGCQTLSTVEPTIASVVPDVSGIDKCFDYIVPARFLSKIRVGDRVRVDLNGRRVSGWVVSLSADSTVDMKRLVDIVSVSGPSVEADVVPLTRWISDTWFGPWRAVLASAQAPRVRQRHVEPRRSTNRRLALDDVAEAAGEVLASGGGLLVVPPLASALSAVGAAANLGPVLVVCPTMRMVSMGAAALRKRGFTTAELPDEWERARAGVDIVIGARTAVLGPGAGLASIVVIDEHEESLREERSPTWCATDIALKRAEMMGVPVLLTSPVPSASSFSHFRDRTRVVRAGAGWPTIEVEDLSDVPVARSLLGSRLLRAAREPGSTVACILNATGVARAVACASCSSLQECTRCGTTLTTNSDGVLNCRRCSLDLGTVCLRCGRTRFKVVSGGVGLVSRQLRKATERDVVEVTASEADSWVTGGLFCGTEALLNRIPKADVVVFCDIDRDLRAPRLSAPREALSMIARAARLVGSAGSLILQTRNPSHPLIDALVSEDPVDALQAWCAADVDTRRELGFPPFSEVIRVQGLDTDDMGWLTDTGCDVAVDSNGILIRSADRDVLESCVAHMRALKRKVRIHARPARY